MTAEPDAINTVLDAHAKSVAAKKTDAALSFYAADVVRFDLAPPLASRGAAALDAGNLQAWFDSWDGTLDYELKDFVVTSAGGIAFAHGLLHLGGRKQGTTHSLWARRTVCLRDAGPGWKIVHDHISTPFYMDGSLKAAVDLIP